MRLSSLISQWIHEIFVYQCNNVSVSISVSRSARLAVDTGYLIVNPTPLGSSIQFLQIFHCFLSTLTTVKKLLITPNGNKDF